jgi:hypothetical protein
VPLNEKINKEIKQENEVSYKNNCPELNIV